MNLHIMAVTKLMQGKYLCHCRRAAHGILGLIDGLFGQFQNKQWFLRDPFRHGQRCRQQFIPWHDLVDHAELFRVLSPQPIRREQQFLGLAHPDFPRVGEEFDAADAHFHHGIAEFRIIRRDNNIAGPGQHQTTGDTFAGEFRSEVQHLPALM